MFILPDEWSKKFDKIYRRKWPVIISLSLISFFSVILSVIIMIERGLKEGPDLSYLRDKLTYEVLDSCAAGLCRFHRINGTYPKTNGKHFFDEIRNLAGIDEIYIYPDSANDNNFLGMKREKSELLKTEHLFLGIGRPGQYITYKYVMRDAYLLYSVGENGIDEQGKGDDLVYVPK